jgi:hypothetical protein
MGDGGLARPIGALARGRHGLTARVAGRWRWSRHLAGRHERWVAARSASACPIRGRARRELSGPTVSRILARWSRRILDRVTPRIPPVAATSPPTLKPAAGRLAGPGWPPPALPARPAAAPGSRVSAPGPNPIPADRPATAPAAASVQSPAAGLQIRHVCQVTRYQRVEARAEPWHRHEPAAVSAAALRPTPGAGSAPSSPAPPAAVGGGRLGARREQPLPGRPADPPDLWPAFALDRIADEVITRIERRAVAQYERRGQGRTR